MKRYPRGSIRQHRGGWEVRLVVNGRTYYERLFLAHGPAGAGQATGRHS